MAPESDIACLTDRVTCFALKTACAFGIAMRLFAWMMYFHALLLVGMVILVGHWVEFVGGCNLLCFPLHL